MLTAHPQRANLRASAPPPMPAPPFSHNAFFLLLLLPEAKVIYTAYPLSPPSWGTVQRARIQTELGTHLAPSGSKDQNGERFKYGPTVPNSLCDLEQWPHVFLPNTMVGSKTE